MRIAFGFLAGLLAVCPVRAQAPAPSQGAAPKLEEVEDRKGPFTLDGQNFTVVLRSVRIAGAAGPDTQALASMEIRDSGGRVQHQETFPHAVENGAFAEWCSVDVRLLAGNAGRGLLVDSGC